MTNFNQTDRRIVIINALHEIGVPASVKGYLYLQEAILIAAGDSNAIFQMSKSIYVPIAEHFQTTAPRVGKSISQAIEIAWDRGDLGTLQRFFGYTVSNTKGKPTNTEFIALVAEHVRFQLNTERTLSIWSEEGFPNRPTSDPA